MAGMLRMLQRSLKLANKELHMRPNNPTAAPGGQAGSRQTSGRTSGPGDRTERTTEGDLIWRFSSTCGQLSRGRGTAWERNTSARNHGSAIPCVLRQDPRLQLAGAW